MVGFFRRMRYNIHMLTGRHGKKYPRMDIFGKRKGKLWISEMKTGC